MTPGAVRSFCCPDVCTMDQQPPRSATPTAPSLPAPPSLPQAQHVRDALLMYFAFLSFFLVFAWLKFSEGSVFLQGCGLFLGKVCTWEDLVSPSSCVVTPSHSDVAQVFLLLVHDQKYFLIFLNFGRHKMSMCCFPPFLILFSSYIFNLSDYYQLLTHYF